MNIPFLYGELNKQVEYLKYKFKSTDNNTIIEQNDDNHTVSIGVNTTNLVTLKQVRKDMSTDDDPVKYYSLYAYNADTRAYDIKIGEEIVVDTSLSDDNASKIETAWIKVGEEQVYDPITNEPLYNDDGTPVMKPILKQVTVDVSQTGNLVLSNIPATAIVDYETHTDDNGNIVQTPIESILDGNAGGVY